jgi:MFS family permease
MGGPGTAQSAEASKGGVYGWYVVGLLTAAYLCAYVDRQILSLLVEPIKRDLHISDTQMGLLQGLAFGLFYTLAGVPLGYAADRLSRRGLLTFSTLAWTVMCAACALASSFPQLLAARVGVSIGEAALGPSAVPLMRDILPRQRLARATSIYMLALPLGGGLATLAGATLLPVLSHAAPMVLPVVGALKPWQETFAVVATPGLLIGLLMLTIRDPRGVGKARADGGAPPIGEVLAYIGRHWRSFVGFGLPGIAATVMVFGVGFWIPSVFIRGYGLTPPEAAGYLRLWGLMSLVLGVAGALTGGALGDFVRRRRQDGYPVLAAIGLAVMTLSYGLFCLAPDPRTALLILAPAAFVGIIPPIMAAAAGAEMAPARMRSLVAAITSPLFTLIGVGFGPAIVAVATMALFHQESALRQAIPIVVGVLSALALPLLWSVRASYRATVAAADAINGEAPLVSPQV